MLLALKSTEVLNVANVFAMNIDIVANQIAMLMMFQDFSHILRAPFYSKCDSASTGSAKKPVHSISTYTVGVRYSDDT